MRPYLIIILCLGACAKKNIIKPEAPPPAKMYIEKFQSGEEPEQWGMFSSQDEGEDFKRILERMKNDPIYSNQMMKTLETL